MSPRTSKFFDADAVRQAVESATTQSDAIRALGQVAHADNYRRLQEACARYGVEVPRKRRAPKVERKNAGPKITAARVEQAASRAVALSDVLRELGVALTAKNYARLEAVATRAEIRLPAKRVLVRVPSPGRADWRRVEGLNTEDLRALTTSAFSQADALRRLGLPTHTEDYRFLREVIHARGLAVPGIGGPRGPKPMSNEEFFSLGPLRGTFEAKKRIRRDGLIPDDRCNECGIPAEWNGKPLAFHLDHINGERADNRLTNLRFLCPNCHSQTDTYCKPKKYRLAA